MVIRRVARRLAFRVGTSDVTERIVLNTPVLRRLAYKHAGRYFAGPDIQDAVATVDVLASRGLLASVDLFGENVADEVRADRETDEYVELAGLMGSRPGTFVSLDCSHLALDYEPDLCRARVRRIASALPEGSRLQLGAEESRRTDATLSLAHAVASDGAPIMVTIQANLRRSPADVDALAQAGIPVRLVKGAYVEDPRVAHAWGPETDTAFVQIANRLEELGHDHSLATHDPDILSRVLSDRDHASIEFLLGVRTADAQAISERGHDVRLYVPYGQRWFRYYARRVAESFGA